MSTIIANTAGSTVATVTDVSTDTSTPLTLVGKGYAGYGKYIQESIYHVMENFANSTAPANPAEGMIWYDTDTSILAYYDGASWIDIMSQGNAMGALLSRLGSADSIDFTTGSTSHNLHTGATGKITIVTGMMLIPTTATGLTGTPPSFGLEVAAASYDVMDKYVMTGMDATTDIFTYQISGVNKQVAAGETVKLAIDSAVGAGNLVCDAFLFGHVRDV